MSKHKIYKTVDADVAAMITDLQSTSSRRLELLRRCERVFDYDQQRSKCPICEKLLPEFEWDDEYGHATDCELDKELKNG